MSCWPHDGGNPMMKYQEIYDALYKSGVHFKNFRTLECTSKILGMCGHPLWLVAEDEAHKLRVWIIDDNRLKIETADTSYSCESREYHESVQRYQFQTQTEMAKFLEKLLRHGIVEKEPIIC